MKILFISNRFNPDIGGIETVSEILATYFSFKNYEVHVLTWTTRKNNNEYPFTIIRKPKFLQLLYEFNWADIVFENNPCIRLSWPSILFKRTYIIALHTWISRSNGAIGLRDQVKIKWLRKADTVIACSDAIRKRCYPAAHVIANPYNEYFRVLSYVPRTKDFVFLGRLVSDKGTNLAIKAFHQFISIENKYRENKFERVLTIIGDGPERKNLEEMVTELKLTGQVVFTGALTGETLVNYLNQHQFLLVPSVWEEPFGMVALEGLACGCYPIVSDGGGLPEAVGTLGAVFPRGDLNALVKCMEAAINGDYIVPEYNSMVEKHLNKHKADEIARQYLLVIENCLKNK